MSNNYYPNVSIYLKTIYYENYIYVINVTNIKSYFENVILPFFVHVWTKKEVVDR